MSAAAPPEPRRPAPLAVIAVAALAVANLVGALGAGLARLGALPAAAGPTSSASIAVHGAVMMAGFFGTLIALERAVALRRGLWVPAAAGLGGVVAWGWGLTAVAAVLWVASAIGLLGLYLHAGRTRAWSLPLAVETAAAALLCAASAGWALGHAELARLGWAGFVVLTIAGERRELTRLVRLPRWAARAFVGIVVIGVVAVALAALGQVGVATAVWWSAAGWLALWLLRFDPALRLLRSPGWSGHTAWCLGVGVLWLAVAALLGLAAPLHAPAGTAAWHVLWLGFVFAMIFGHAPIMLPALTRARPRPTRWALPALALMGLSVALRAGATVIGAPAPTLALAGGLHVAAIVWFAVAMITAVVRQPGRRA